MVQRLGYMRSCCKFLVWYRYACSFSIPKFSILFALLRFFLTRFSSRSQFFIKIMTKGVNNDRLTETPLEYCILAAGTAVAWVYAVELNITICLTFKRKGGLYFWSLLLSSWGLTLHALGFILKFLVGTGWRLNIPLITTGWVAMVTGQSFVLYSRLHLVVRNQRALRYILYLILTNVFALHLPMVIFTYGSNSPSPGPWIGKFN